MNTTKAGRPGSAGARTAAALPRWSAAALAAALAATLVACASPGEPAGPAAQEPPEAARKVTVLAVTDDMALIRVNAGRPAEVLARVPVDGLAAGERLVGIDFRVARGVLYALSSAGRLYTLDPATGRLSAVNRGARPVRLSGGAHGFDFNPTVDRIRVVSADGTNLRLHPDTAEPVDGDPAAAGLQADRMLAYAADDPNAARRPAVVAAAYTYNPRDDRLTTNFAIDRALGALVLQGSREGVSPAVSPNAGVLRTVGPLGTGALADASFDIADAGGAAIAAVRAPRGDTRLLLVDLDSGRGSPLGRLGDGRPVVGIAIEP
jgi:hypothetical protein